MLVWSKTQSIACVCLPKQIAPFALEILGCCAQKEQVGKWNKGGLEFEGQKHNKYVYA